MFSSPRPMSRLGITHNSQRPPPLNKNRSSVAARALPQQSRMGNVLPPQSSGHYLARGASGPRGNCVCANGSLGYVH